MVFCTYLNSYNQRRPSRQYLRLSLDKPVLVSNQDQKLNQSNMLCFSFDAIHDLLFSRRV